MRTVAKQHGVPAPKPAELVPEALALRIAALERNVEARGSIDKENLHHIGRALQMTDAHLMVLRRVLGELSPEKKKLEPYYTELFRVLKEGGDNAGMRWAEGMSAEEAIASAKETPAEPPSSATVVSPNTTEDIVEVFGGDYEQGQSATAG